MDTEQTTQLAIRETLGAAVTLDPSGRKWRVRAFEYGLSKNTYPHGGRQLPLLWTEKSGRSALRHLDGAQAFVDHGSRSVRNLLGKYTEPALEARGPVATLTILESEAAIGRKMLDAQKINLQLGFSVDAMIGVRPVKHQGKDALEVEEIAQLHSVDLVSAASSGGTAVAVLEQTQIFNEKGSPTMSEQVVEQVTDLQKRVEEAEKKQRVAESRQVLSQMLLESKLPSALTQIVRGDLEGKECAREEIAAKIQRVREGFAAVAPGPHRTSTAPAIHVGLEPRDKRQIALDMLYGVTHEWKPVREGKMLRWEKGPELNRDVKAFDGIREAYVTITGDTEVSGNIDGLQIREDWTAADFANVLANTLHRKLLQGYAGPDYGMDLLVPPNSRKPVQDFRTQERVRVGYFGDLSVVEPETADYAEIAKPTDEKASYAVVQFGNLVTVTRKTIINDDLGMVGEIVEKLGRSARRTLAQRVFNLLINNAAIYDAVTWFHAASHGANLTTTALSAAELDVIRTKMRKQVEKDSGARLGIGPAILVVPVELEGTAKAENMREFLDSNLAPSKVRYMFGQNGERIIVSPLLMDATDYYLFADQTQVPCLEVGFLGGREQPEFFLADAPTVGKAFTGDRIVYKIRHEYEAVVTDFRGAHKASVV